MVCDKETLFEWEKNPQLGCFSSIYCTNSIDKMYLDVTMLLGVVENWQKGNSRNIEKLSHIFDTWG